MNNLTQFKIVLFAAGFILFACGRETNDSPVIATSGTAALHLNEISSFLTDNTTLEISKIQVQNYVQRWAEEEMIYQAAAAEKFAEHPDLQKKIYELQKNFIVAAYLHEKIDSKVVVTEADIQNYYAENAAEFKRADNFYNLQIILVGSSNDAYQVRRQLDEGEEFEAVAKEFSLDASKSDGGKLGWVTANRLPNEAARQLPTIAPGTISSPIRTSVGYFLINVLDVRKKDETQTLEEIREILDWRIRARNREELYKEFLDQLKEKTKTTVNWSYLDSLNLER